MHTNLVYQNLLFSLLQTVHTPMRPHSVMYHGSTLFKSVPYRDIRQFLFTLKPVKKSYFLNLVFALKSVERIIMLYILY